MGCSIGPKTLQQAKDDIGHIIDIYRKKIAETFLKEDPFKISIKVTFKGRENGNVGIKTDIDFVTDRVKDDLESQVNEDQGELFPSSSEQKKQPVQGMNPAPEPVIYPYLPEEWPSGLAWLIGIDGDTEDPVMVGKCAECNRVIMSTDIFESDGHLIRCLPCCRSLEFCLSEEAREAKEWAWQEAQELFYLEDPAPVIHTDADEVAEEEASIMAQNAKGDDLSWNRKVECRVISATVKPPEPNEQICVACLKKSDASECWIEVPGHGTCERCGKEDRLYIVAKTAPAKTTPLCMKYKAETVCDYVSLTACETADCCQLCDKKECTNRCQSARGLDEVTESAA